MYNKVKFIICLRAGNKVMKKTLSKRCIGITHLASVNNLKNDCWKKYIVQINNKSANSFFFITRTLRICFYSIVWGTVYSRGMRHRGTLRHLNKLALSQSPLQATQLKIYVYIVNFVREIYNTMHYRPIDLYIIIEYYDDMYTNILLLLKWKIKYNNGMHTLDITWALHIGLYLSNKQLTLTTTTL